MGSIAIAPPYKQRGVLGEQNTMYSDMSLDQLTNQRAQVRRLIRILVKKGVNKSVADTRNLKTARALERTMSKHINGEIVQHSFLDALNLTDRLMY